MARPPHKKLTYEDYVAFPNDGIRRELISGEVYELTPGPGARHQLIIGRFFAALYAHVGENAGRGIVFLSPFVVVLSSNDVVQPDIVYLDETRLGALTEANVRGVPALVVEVVSDSRHDRVRKLNLYARAGIPEYVIVDPVEDRIEVYLHDGRGYGAPALVHPGETLTLAQLPGFSINVADLLRR